MRATKTKIIKTQIRGVNTHLEYKSRGIQGALGSEKGQTSVGRGVSRGLLQLVAAEKSPGG